LAVSRRLPQRSPWRANLWDFLRVCCALEPCVARLSSHPLVTIFIAHTTSTCTVFEVSTYHVPTPGCLRLNSSRGDQKIHCDPSWFANCFSSCTCSLSLQAQASTSLVSQTSGLGWHPRISKWSPTSMRPSERMLARIHHLMSLSLLASALRACARQDWCCPCHSHATATLHSLH